LARADLLICITGNLRLNVWIELIIDGRLFSDQQNIRGPKILLLESARVTPSSYFAAALIAVSISRRRIALMRD
jgi:hypothetical protein